MSEDRESTIKGLIEQMTPEEKAGQVLVVDFTGVTVSPHLVNVIDRYNCAGLRVQTNIRYKNRYGFQNSPDKGILEQRSYRVPKGPCKDFSFNRPAPSVTPRQYAGLLNGLKEIAMNRRIPTPLHVVLDQEGGGSENYTCGNPLLFPRCMGLAASNDDDLVYRAARVMGRQLKDAGIDWLQSPVLDVVTNPDNPGIGSRSFSDDPDTVARFGLALARGLKDGGVLAMAKHFPGVGASPKDSHYDLPIIDASREEMMEVHLSPYVKLIEDGVPSVMIAHTVYPGLTDDGLAATVSPDIITKLLRETMGFNGVISTDNMLMAGIIKHYDILDGAIRAIKAGTSIILLRDENPLVDEIYHGLVKAIESGDLPMDAVDDAIFRNLSAKYDYGLFDNGGLVDPGSADVTQNEDEARSVEIETARKSVILMRQEDGLLPLAPDTRVMLIDQVGFCQWNVNNFHCHPGVFWEAMLEQSRTVVSVEIEGFQEPDERDEKRIFDRLDEADVIVATDYGPKDKKSASGLLKRVAATGVPLIVVTHSPYNVPVEFKTVLVTFSDATESLRAAAEIVYGKREATGKLTVRL